MPFCVPLGAKLAEIDEQFITPQFLAFASPVEPGYSTTATSSGPPASPAANARLPRSFRNVLDQFEKKNVKMVIRCAKSVSNVVLTLTYPRVHRLNKKLYNSKHFTDLGL